MSNRTGRSRYQYTNCYNDCAMIKYTSVHESINVYANLISTFFGSSVLRFFSKYPAMGVALYRRSVMASTRSADSLTDNEYLRRISAIRVFQSRSVRGKNEYL